MNVEAAFTFTEANAPLEDTTPIIDNPNRTTREAHDVDQGGLSFRAPFRSVLIASYSACPDLQIP
jgi:hypothetical protein